jgi:hypothetical protein
MCACSGTDLLSDIYLQYICTPASASAQCCVQRSLTLFSLPPHVQAICVVVYVMCACSSAKMQLVCNVAHIWRWVTILDITLETPIQCCGLCGEVSNPKIANNPQRRLVVRQHRKLTYAVAYVFKSPGP